MKLPLIPVKVRERAVKRRVIEWQEGVAVNVLPLRFQRQVVDDLGIGETERRSGGKPTSLTADLLRCCIRNDPADKSVAVSCRVRGGRDLVSVVDHGIACAPAPAVEIIRYGGGVDSPTSGKDRILADAADVYRSIRALSKAAALPVIPAQGKV